MLNARHKIKRRKSLKYNSILLIIFLALPFGSLFSQNPESLFEEANQAYASGDYQNAIVLYQQILQQGIESGEVFFNLGNAYYKQNMIGLAILNYEKSRKYLEGDAALEQNLQLARLKIVDEIDEIPKLFIDIWWYEISHLVSMNALLWLTLFLFTLFIITLIMQLFLKRRTMRKFVWISFSVFIFILILTIGQIYEFETSSFGVILEQKVSVVSAPDEDGTEVFILHEGTKVQVNREMGEWMEITIPDGKTGWMKSSHLGLI
jgi:tetratricopeptide (TPR) repeat protein